MKTNNGYIKSYRKIIDNEFLAHDNTAFLVFVKLLHMVDLDTGELTTGRYLLAQQVNVNPNTLYNALERLKDQHLINIKTNNRFSTITICKWKQYQQPDNTPVNNKSTTDQQQINTKQEIKNKEIKNITNVIAEPPEIPETKIVKYGNQDINEMFEYWEQTRGYPVIANKLKNRYAINNMLKKHGKDKLRQVVSASLLARQDKFSGVKIADFTELQYKFNELQDWVTAQNVQRSRKRSAVIS